MSNNWVKRDRELKWTVRDREAKGTREVVNGRVREGLLKGNMNGDEWSDGEEKSSLRKKRGNPLVKDRKRSQMDWLLKGREGEMYWLKSDRDVKLTSIREKRVTSRWKEMLNGPVWLDIR